VNLIERIEPINLYAASLEKPILNKKDYNFSLKNFNSRILNVMLPLITKLYSFENLNKNAHKIIIYILL